MSLSIWRTTVSTSALEIRSALLRLAFKASALQPPSSLPSVPHCSFPTESSFSPAGQVPGHLMQPCSESVQTSFLSEHFAPFLGLPCSTHSSRCLQNVSSYVQPHQAALSKFLQPLCGRLSAKVVAHRCTTPVWYAAPPTKSYSLFTSP